MKCLRFQVLTSNIDVFFQRARVPGGWFVIVGSETITVSPQPQAEAVVLTQYQWSSFFYPDPNHQWDGNSVPALAEEVATV